ncbi:MAG: hypothetical protein AAF533_15890 [Acidobacteriota bacterium]
MSEERKEVRLHFFKSIAAALVLFLFTLIGYAFHNLPWGVAAMSFPLKRELVWDEQAGAYRESTPQKLAGHVVLMVNTTSASQSVECSVEDIAGPVLLAAPHDTGVGLLARDDVNGSQAGDSISVDQLQLARGGALSLVMLGDSKAKVSTPDILQRSKALPRPILLSPAQLAIYASTFLLVTLGLVKAFGHLKSAGTSHVTTSFSDQLRDALQQAEMDVEELEKKAGVPAETLRRFLDSKQGLTTKQVDGLFQALGTLHLSAAD